MTALSITAANVVPAANAVIVYGKAGETITAGQPVYRAAATRKFMKSDADSATAEVRKVFGVAVNGASLNQPIAIQKGGDLNPGATLVVGEIYCLGETAGGIVPKGDQSTGEYVTVIGVATSASNLKMGLLEANAAVPA